MNVIIRSLVYGIVGSSCFTFPTIVSGMRRRMQSKWPLGHSFEPPTVHGWHGMFMQMALASSCL